MATKIIIREDITRFALALTDEEMMGLIKQAKLVKTEYLINRISLSLEPEEIAKKIKEKFQKLGLKVS